MPQISIITTVHNREKYLRQCLDSLLNQTFTDWECIIWDDGSQDDSLRVAYQYAIQDNRFKLNWTGHQGVVKSCQSAIAISSAPYIGILDSDDWLAPTCLEKCIKPFTEYQWDCGVVYTQYWDVFKDGRTKLGSLCALFDKNKLLFPGNFMCFHFQLFKRSLYDQVGGIDLSIPVSMDYDLMLKLSEVTDFAYIEEPLYYYRHHGNQISSHSRNLQVLSCQMAAQNAISRRGITHLESVLSWQVKAKG